MKEIRPWGFYRIIEENENYKIKYIYVAPGQRLSLQRHKYRAESWVIIHGRSFITIDDSTFIIRERESVSIEKGQLHRIEAPADDYIEFIEIQTGTYFGEDDIERIEDDYGR